MATKLINNMAKLQKEDLTGKRIGRLTILEVLPQLPYTHKKVIAKCECGKEKEYILKDIKRGHTKSCGCYMRERAIKSSITHGLTAHPLYSILADMKTRCENPKFKQYHIYGGKGVRVCDEWRDNPELFIKWALENGWQKGMQIDKDKIPKEMGIPALLYGPLVCCVLTRKQNSLYRTTNRNLEYKGETKCLVEWSEFFSIPMKTFWARMQKCNWDMYLYVKKWNNP